VPHGFGPDSSLVTEFLAFTLASASKYSHLAGPGSEFCMPRHWPHRSTGQLSLGPRQHLGDLRVVIGTWVGLLIYW
jgi:hypothetical protein